MLNSTGSAVHTADSSAVVRKVTLRLMPVIFICSFFAFFDRVNISFAKVAMTVDLGLSNAAYGLGVSLFAIGYMIFEVPSNMILYRVGTRQWIARIMIGWGLATSAMVFVTSEWQFFALRFLIGALEAGFMPGILYYLTTWYPTSHRSRSISYLLMGGMVSGMLGGPIAGMLITYMEGVGGHAGWHWLFLFGGLPCVALGFVVYKFLDNRIEDAKWLSDDEKRELISSIEQTPQTGKSRSLAGALRTPGFLMLGLIYFLIVMASSSLVYWVPDLIKSAGDGSHLAVGFLTSIPYIFGAIAMVTVARYADAAGERRYYLMACLLIASLGFMAAAHFNRDVVIVVIALSVAGSGISGGSPAFWALPPKLLIGAGAAGGIALISSMGHLGGIVSPIMIGTVKDLSGHAAPALYLIAGLCLLACLILALFSPQQIKANDREPPKPTLSLE